MEGYRELMAAAEAETGLADFGEDSFREGLELLVGSLNDEARLNATGEQSFREMIVGHLKQRLLVEEWYARHPEIQDVELLPPLFGVSLPRTGSTVLSFLLASDPAIRYLRAWEAAAPCPPPSTVVGPDPRRTAVRAFEHASKDMAHTPTGIDGPMECHMLMTLDFKSMIFPAFATVPRYARWLVNADHEPTYAYHRRVLKLLQWGEPTRAWRLKSPVHLLHMSDLDKAFPDARFVMTHRDPTEVILSIAKVYSDLAARFTDTVDKHFMAAINVEFWSEGMRRAIEFRDRGNDARFYDIDFRAMHKDPVGQVRGLYEWLGEPMSSEFEANMASWWIDNTATRKPREKPDPLDYGIDLDHVSDLFVDYRERVAHWLP